jgi:hypothetical protein
MNPKSAATKSDLVFCLINGKAQIHQSVNKILPARLNSIASETDLKLNCYF